MSESQTDGIAEINEAELGQVQGGLLLPAVQKVREAAARLLSTADDEIVAGPGGSGHLR